KAIPKSHSITSPDVFGETPLAKPGLRKRTALRSAFAAIPKNLNEVHPMQRLFFCLTISPGYRRPERSLAGAVSCLTRIGRPAVAFAIVGVALVTLLTPAFALSGGSVAINISARAIVSSGDDVLIGGFIVTGTVRKEVLIRALGPSLGVILPGI